MPNSSSAVVDILSTTNNPVVLNGSASISTLTMGASTSLNVTAGVFTVYGATISNAGMISLDTQLELNDSVTLSGAGTLTMANGQIGTSSSGQGSTLTNQSPSTIVGYGGIGANASAVYPNLSFGNSGTVNANSSGNTLAIEGTGASITNSGTLEATGGGILALTTSSAIDDSNGHITASGSGSTVEVSTTIQGGTLKTSTGGVMETVGTAGLDGITAGAITLSNGSTYTAGSGTVTKIDGTINLGTSAASTLALGGQLELTGNTTLTGPGSLVMTSTSGNTGQIGTNSTPYMLTNQSTISGSGLIGSNASSVYPSLSLANSGTINANQSASTLAIGGSGTSITNTGTFEATGGGILSLVTSAVIDNNTGNITANAGTVDVSTTIQGGMLHTLNGGVVQTVGTATLDASTQGAITLIDASTYTAGSGTLTKITGALNLGTTNAATNLALGGQLQLTGNTTLSGPGSLLMTSTDGSTGQIGTNSGAYTLTNESTIAGSGLIGSNASSVYPNLSLDNSGTVNANSSVSALTIGGSGTSITNTGIFEATNGGTLSLATSAAVDNLNGIITAKGSGSTVEVGTTIQGGTLTTTGGAAMETVGSGAFLDGSTQGAITLSNGSAYSAGAGLTSIVGTLNLGTTAASTLALSGQLRLTGDTTLSGPGALIMSGGSNVAQIGTNGGTDPGNIDYTLSNQSTIQGFGLIGSNVGSLYSAFSLNNSGTVNSNSSGNTLTIAGTGVITNTGVLEATGGGTLAITATNPVNNLNGNITANGSGSIVEVDNATIQGGTLNTLGGGVMESAGSAAVLDGLTNGAITISDGSTYTAGSAPLTSIVGTVNLGTITGGTLALAGQLRLTGDTNLSGPGSLNMAAGQIGTSGSFYTLTNDSTIQGTGFIGSNVGSLYQNLNLTNGGTLNAVGGTLLVEGSGTTSNAGTMAVQSASTLNITNTFTNFASGTGTLTGGTYNVNGGTFEFNGANIVNNAADIILAGAASQILNNAGNTNALANFDNNAVGGVFQLGAGRSFTTSAPGGGNFTNNGSLIVGGGDVFKVAGALSNFAGTTLTGGSYYVAGTLQFGASGSSLVTNDANLTLAGTSAKLLDLGGNNLLGAFTTNASGATFTVAADGSYTTPGSFSNSGTMDLEQGSALKVAGNLSNHGTVTTNGQNLEGGANTLTVNGTLTNNTGDTVTIGANNDTSDVASVGVLTNSGTVTVDKGATLNLTSAGADANSSAIAVNGGTLDVQAGSLTNSGILDLEQKGTLKVTGNLTNTGTLTTNNSNLGGGANTITVTGTLTNDASDAITIGAHGDTNDTASVGLLANAGTITVDKGASLKLTGTGTDSNTGAIALDSGTMTVVSGGVFTNSGTLDEETGGKLSVTGSMTNAGTLTTNGSNQGGAANSITVSGKLTNNGGATVTIGDNSDTSDKATVGTLANSGTVTVDTGATLTLSASGSDTNAGAIAVTGTLDIDKAATLSGAGAITLTGGAITGVGGTATLDNKSTIQGSGTISNLGITNSGTLSANQAAALIILPTAAGLDNTGTIKVSSGDTMQIGTSAGGALTNFSGTTLTGGIYSITGTLQFGASGTTIATNAANITLNGAGEIVDFSGHNILTGFNNNASAGIFKLASAASLTTTGGSFTNAGLFTVSTGTTFTVGGSSFNFTQTGGTSTIDGILSSSTLGTITLSGGSLAGAGTLGDNVVDDSTLTAGDSAAKTGQLKVADTYTQGSTGTLDIEINGATLGTKYDQLKVTQGATLSGTLNIDLGTFTPTVGQKFTILTASSVTGTFTTVNGLAINGTEHFTISYNAGSVVLTVVSGALPASNFGSNMLATQLLHPPVSNISAGKVHYGLSISGHNLARVPAAPVASFMRTTPVAGPSTFGSPRTGMHGFRPMDSFGSTSVASTGASAGDPGTSGAFGIAPVSAASYNSMSGMNHMRFECGVDLKGLLKTSRKRLVKGLWASPDSADALYLGYMTYTTSH